MLIIGEKINGTRKEVGAAVIGRDVAFIQELARRQADAGATYLDVNAGTGKTEPDDLVWLVETVQAAVGLPFCVDSANPAALRAALPLCAQTPLVNSISGERARLEGVLPVVAELGCPVVALAADDAGIAKDPEARLAVVERVLEATRAAGVADDLVYVDPLVLPLAGSRHQRGRLARGDAGGQGALPRRQAVYRPEQPLLRPAGAQPDQPGVPRVLGGGGPGCRPGGSPGHRPDAGAAGGRDGARPRPVLSPVHDGVPSGQVRLPGQRSPRRDRRGSCRPPATGADA